MRKLKAKMENAGTQTKQCSVMVVETVTEFLNGFPKETQTEPSIKEDTAIQIKEPYIFSQGTVFSSKISPSNS